MRLASGGTIYLRCHVDIATEPAAGTSSVRNVGYRYELLDLDRREFIAYHWHPSGVSPAREPHIHVSVATTPVATGAGDSLVVAEHHWPTGGVSFADITRLLLAELSVAPRRADWPSVVQSRMDERDTGR